MHCRRKRLRQRREPARDGKAAPEAGRHQQSEAEGVASRGPTLHALLLHAKLHHGEAQSPCVCAVAFQRDSAASNPHACVPAIAHTPPGMCERVLVDCTPSAKLPSLVLAWVAAAEVP